MKTTLVVLSVILLQQGLVAGLWAVLAAMRMARAAAWHWSAAAALVCGGLVLIAQRDALPVWAGFWLANAFILAGFMAVRRGLALFVHGPTGDAEQAVVWVGVMAALALALGGGMSWRVVTISSLSLGYVMLRSAWTVQRDLGGEFGRRLSAACAAPLVVIGLVFLLRAFFAWRLPDTIGHSVHADNAANIASMIAFLAAGLLMQMVLMGLVMARLVLRLRHQGEHDELTGLLNRRAFQRRVADEAERLRRYGQAYGVLTIDLDHFKRINDRYGHPGGDAVLREVGAVLRRLGRSVDHVARAGGEEFWMLVPSTGVDGALGLAERLRQAVAAMRVPTAQGEVMLTVSIGVAVAGPGETHEALMHRADAALYRAKHAGRDRVELAAPPAGGAGAREGSVHAAGGADAQPAAAADTMLR